MGLYPIVVKRDDLIKQITSKTVSIFESLIILANIPSSLQSLPVFSSQIEMVLHPII